MAFFTTKTGDVYEQDIANNELIKAAQAELIFIPFGVPWITLGITDATKYNAYARAWWPGGRGSKGMSNYYPYGLTAIANETTAWDFADETGVIDQNMGIEGTNLDNEFVAPPPGTIGEAQADPLRTLFFTRFVDNRANVESAGVPTATIGLEKRIDWAPYFGTAPPTPHGALGAPWSGSVSDGLALAWYKSSHLLPGEDGVIRITEKSGFEERISKLDAMGYTYMTPKSYRDATFSIKKPFVEVAYGEALGEKIGISDPVKVKAHYNFYLQPYENVVSTLEIGSDTTAGPTQLPETVLPNIYTLISDLEKEGFEEYQFAEQWAPWKADPTEQKIAAEQLAKKWNSSGNREYFNTMATIFSTIASHGNIPHTDIGRQIDTKRYYTTGMASNKIKDFMDEADKTKKHFPMYVDIEVPPANQGKVGAILHKAGLMDQFMQLMIAAMFPRPYYALATDSTPSFFRKTFIIKKDSFIKDDPINGLNLSGWQNSLYEEPLIKIWLNEILLDEGWEAPPDLDSEQAAVLEVPSALKNWYITDSDPAGFMNKLNDQIGNVPFIRPVIIGKKKGSPIKFINNIKWLATKKKIKKIINEKTRSVKEIYDGDYAYSEVLFYEIAKFRSTKDENGVVKEAGGTFVQNIFLPNTPGMEVLKYVDTQVKYGEEYYYQVYAHTFVVGTQYRLSDQSIQLVDKSTLTAKFKFKPTVYLMRVPYYNTYVTMNGAVTEEGNPITKNVWNWNPSKLERTPIHDMPPVFPDAVFLPLYGERDKILLNTNFNVGEYELAPVFLDEKEKVNLDKIRRNQKKMPPSSDAPGPPITFKSDDFCGQIELLRIDKKPTSYAAFDPTNDRIAILGGSSAFGYIDDTLEPNKDYYYVVRAKDVHGNYSNPSPIYQARLVAREGEAPYAIFKMFFIEEVEEKKPVIRKNLMKYIRIQPSFKQTYINAGALTSGLDSAEEVSDTILSANLGETGLKTVFGEKFKIRFTSKKTGKKFDLNLNIQSPYIAPAENKSTKGAQDEYSSGKC